MKKLVLVLAVFAVPVLAQERGGTDHASSVAPGTAHDVASAGSASSAARLAEFFHATSGLRTIFADDLQARMQAKVPMTIVDVRPEGDFKAGHVPGAINLPLKTLFHPDSLRKLPADGSLLVLVCATGHMESMALGGLVALGYQPWVLRFGMMGWKPATPVKVWSDGEPAGKVQTIAGLGGPVVQ